MTLLLFSIPGEETMHKVAKGARDSLLKNESSFTHSYVKSYKFGIRVSK